MHYMSYRSYFYGPHEAKAWAVALSVASEHYEAPERELLLRSFMAGHDFPLELYKTLEKRAERPLSTPISWISPGFFHGFHHFDPFSMPSKGVFIVFFRGHRSELEADVCGQAAAAAARAEHGHQ